MNQKDTEAVIQVLINKIEKLERQVDRLQNKIQKSQKLELNKQEEEEELRDYYLT